MKEKVKDIQDVLALAKKVSQDEKKFKIGRHNRKAILKVMNHISIDVREMKNKKNEWIRLGEVLHPGEFKKKWPRSYVHFQLMRTSKVKSWWGKLDEEMERGLTPGLNWLMEKPEEFCRRIDWLLRAERNIVEIAEIANKIRVTAGKLPMNELFKLYKWFIPRNRPSKIIRMRRGQPIPPLEPLSETAWSLVLTMLEEAIEYKLKRLHPVKKTLKIISYLLLKSKKMGKPDEQALDASVGEMDAHEPSVTPLTAKQKDAIKQVVKLGREHLDKMEKCETLEQLDELESEDEMMDKAFEDLMSAVDDVDETTNTNENLDAHFEKPEILTGNKE